MNIEGGWIKYKNKVTAVHLMWAVILVFSFFAAIQSFRSIKDIPLSSRAQDLRTRVVGARLLGTGHSPYYFKWQPGVSETLLDPLEIPSWEPARNRLTVSPFTLLVQSSMNRLNYLQIKRIWDLCQIFFLCYIVLSFVFLAKAWMNRILIFIFSLIFIACTPGWQYHYALGQIYIFYAFLFCLIYQLYRARFKDGKFLSGVVFGFLVLFRPPMIIASLPLLINKQIKFMIGALAGLLIGFSLSVAAGQWADWCDYYSVMTGKGAELSARPLTRQEVALEKNLSKMKYPRVVEGVSFKQYTYDVVGYEQSKPVKNEESVSNNRVDKYFSEWRAFHQEASLLVFLVLAWTLLIFSYRELNTSKDSLVFLWAFLFYMLLDNFLPAYRYQYNYVQWIFPIALLFSQYQILKSAFLPLLLLGFSLNLRKIGWIPNTFMIGEIFVFLAFLLILKYEHPLIQRDSSDSSAQKKASGG